MGTKKRGLESEICIYCNLSHSTRRGDHIPPQCFFKDKRGFSLIQVPCCQECNGKISNHDQLVRNFIAALEDNSHHSYLTEELHNTLSRDWNKDGRATQFISHFVDIETIKKSDTTKFKLPEEMTEKDFKELDIPLKTDHIFQEFGERIIRALLFKDYGMRITHPFERKVHLLSQWKEEKKPELIGIFESFEKMKKLIQFQSIGGDAFRWITYLEKLNGIAACWIQFYAGTEIGIILASKQIMDVNENRS